ncbi:YbfB/YjiJ family MFS transporter [Marinobacterium sediminicola]|uniref:Predicted arabinose efflux permease, MFS family n=1 Tax=Marinobacterium sediminicola TaxID=518898 RepID=A0ABY1RW85_9GAMM|nr:YbfB/YjiJ family MFS transporter [Marinobacterium sediminicola]ULG70432.1 YbfB/YjiJ family MFS transporter [Marinobacterium sediminicola]SMR69365.1 Predicted arabinose efflux permease, MFS family [Marinobacterium sediminicola]
MLTEKVRVLIASVAAVVITVGIARFAYTPMLPEMMSGAGLNNALAGMLATANYAGYLSGALLISFIRSSAVKIWLYKAGLLGAVLTTGLMGYSSEEWVWYVLRFLSGLSSSAGVLIGAGLLMSWLLRQGHKPELGIFFSGLGIGIVLTALLAESIRVHFSWDQQWAIYGFAALILLLPVWWWSPDYSRCLPTMAATPVSNGRKDSSFMLLLQLSYFCAGVGYVVTATFLVAIAEASPLLAGRGWLIWLMTGIAAAPACWLWDLLVRRQGDWLALLLAYLLNAVSVLLLLLLSGLAGVMLSAVIYGASFIGIVSMTLAMVGRLYPENPSRPMGRLTFGYGIAQVLAPMMVGYLAQSEGNYQSGLLFTLAVISAGAVLLAGAWSIQRQGMESAGTGQVTVSVSENAEQSGLPVATRTDVKSGAEFS